MSRYVGNNAVTYIDAAGESKGGKKNIWVSGVPKNVTPQQLEQIIKDAIAAGKSQKHIKALRGMHKVITRNGCADVKLLMGQAGTILAIAEVTSIVNHGYDYLDLQQIGQQENPDGSTTYTYFSTKNEKSGLLGAGPPVQTGTLLYTITVPKERVERDGPPKEQMRFTVYNREAFSEILQEMGIREEWYTLPDDIKCAKDLLDAAAEGESSGKSSPSK